MGKEIYESFAFYHDMFVAGLYGGMRNGQTPANNVSKRKEHHD